MAMPMLQLDPENKEYRSLWSSFVSDMSAIIKAGGRRSKGRTSASNAAISLVITFWNANSVE